MKTDAVDFKLDRIPAHSGWIYQFTMQAIQTRNSSDDVMYFVYPADSVLCPKSLTRQLSLDKLYCLPVDFLYSSTNYQEGYRKVLLTNRGPKLSSGIALDDYNACCDKQTKEYFFANVTMLRGEYFLFQRLLELSFLRLKGYHYAKGYKMQELGPRISIYDSIND